MLLIPLPATDFDPSEAALPWRLLRRSGADVRFATPAGRPASADFRMLTGAGLGALKGLLMARADAREAYAEMERAPEFQKPLSYVDVRARDFSAALLPGGHAPGMRIYLESRELQTFAREILAAGKPLGAICHGVLLAARARDAAGRSILYERRTTALLKSQELLAWNLTRLWLGDYYRTYPVSVEDEVKSLLKSPAQFERGPAPLGRDSLERLDRGFVVRDGRFVSARWPGDAHRFATELMQLL